MLHIHYCFKKYIYIIKDAAGVDLSLAGGDIGTIVISQDCVSGINAVEIEYSEDRIGRIKPICYGFSTKEVKIGSVLPIEGSEYKSAVFSCGNQFIRGIHGRMNIITEDIVISGISVMCTGD